MKRLYAAAKTRGYTTPTAVARNLNISHQRLKNWDVRGISQQGANMAQLAFGISSTWILNGIGPEAASGLDSSPSHRATLDPAILHEAITLLLFDLDHGGPRPARSASDLVMGLYRRIEANGGRLPPDEERAFEAEARARGQQGMSANADVEVARGGGKSRRGKR